MTANILNKMGYSKHYPHAVAFAPSGVFGCSLVDLRIEQGLLQVQSLLDSIGTEHKVGTVMLISLRHLQIEAGVSFDLLLCPTPPLVYLTDCWLVSLRQFCATYGVTLKVKKNCLPQIARVGNTLLMDVAITLGLKHQELLDLNVTTFSDIATADGSVLHRWTWKGLRIPDRTSRFKFARQETPTPYQCGLWRKLLRSLLSPSATAQHNLLQTPLMPWIQKSNMIWGAMIYDTHLYRRDPDVDSGERAVAVHFAKFLELSVGSRSKTAHYEELPNWYTATTPVLAIPADLTGQQLHTASYATNEYVLSPAAPKTFQEWLAKLPMAERRMLSLITFDMCDAEALLIQYIQVECTLFIGIDGGKRHHSGIFS